ncbi:hypothetical protein J3F83DRAFT_730165 [Trichoderma novae-zelandiae]
MKSCRPGLLFESFCRGLPLGAAPLARDAAVLKPAPRFRNSSLSASLHLQEPHLPRSAAWEFSLPWNLGLGTGRLAIWHRQAVANGGARLAPNLVPRGQRVANQRAGGQRQPAALRRIRRNKHEKLDE